MFSLKAGVDVKGLHPEALLILLVAQPIWDAVGVDLVVTSCMDGKHGPNSFHYQGLAVDLRTRDFQPGAEVDAANVLRERLGRHYDVVLEKDHLHVEHDHKE